MIQRHFESFAGIFCVVFFVFASCWMEFPWFFLFDAGGECGHGRPWKRLDTELVGGVWVEGWVPKKGKPVKIPTLLQGSMFADTVVSKFFFFFFFFFFRFFNAGGRFFLAFFGQEKWGIQHSQDSSAVRLKFRACFLQKGQRHKALTNCAPRGVSIA